MRRVPNFIAASATPNDWEVSLSEGKVTELLVRPTGITDPLVEVRPVKNQVSDIIEEIKRLLAKAKEHLLRH